MSRTLLCGGLKNVDAVNFPGFLLNGFVKFNLFGTDCFCYSHLKGELFEYLAERILQYFIFNCGVTSTVFN